MNAVHFDWRYRFEITGVNNSLRDNTDGGAGIP